MSVKMSRCIPRRWCSYCTQSKHKVNRGVLSSVKGGVDVEDGDTDNWEKFVDEETGGSFFVNRRSGKSVWERPGEDEI